MSKIENIFSLEKGIIVKLITNIFSKDTLLGVKNNFNKYYINNVNIDILYIISIVYIVYSFFIKDISFIAIFIICFFIIYFFKKYKSIIYVFPLIICNIIYELFLKKNKYFKKLSNTIYKEGYKSSRHVNFNGFEKSEFEGDVSKEDLEKDLENSKDDEREPDDDDPLEGGEDLDPDGDGDVLLEEQDEDAKQDSETDEKTNVEQMNKAGKKAGKISNAMSKRMQ